MASYIKKDIDFGSIDLWSGGKYTTYDAGQTWQYDPNIHFSHDGKDYYIREGEDFTNVENWKADTVAGGHMSISDYTALMIRRNALAETQAQNQRMYELAQERMDMQRRWLAEEKARLAAEAQKRQEEAAEQAEKEKRRLYLSQLGNQPTMLTGGDGVEEAAPIHKRTLGAV